MMGPVSLPTYVKIGHERPSFFRVRAGPQIQVKLYSLCFYRPLHESLFKTLVRSVLLIAEPGLENAEFSFTRNAYHKPQLESDRGIHSNTAHAGHPQRP